MQRATFKHYYPAIAPGPFSATVAKPYLVASLHAFLRKFRETFSSHITSWATCRAKEQEVIKWLGIIVIMY
jgi:hypothetical protein